MASVTWHEQRAAAACAAARKLVSEYDSEFADDLTAYRRLLRERAEVPEFGRADEPSGERSAEEVVALLHALAREADSRLAVLATTVDAASRIQALHTARGVLLGIAKTIRNNWRKHALAPKEHAR